MTERELFINALERRPQTGRVPHFEMVFQLTMEALGKVAPAHRHFGNWDQMSKEEQFAQRRDIAQTYIDVAEKYGHSAIFLQVGPDEYGADIAWHIRELSGDKFFILVHGDPTFPIPDGNSMLDFTYRMADEPDEMKEEAQAKVDNLVRAIETNLAGKGLVDGFCLCSDYCLNTGPFLSPNQFSEFVAPYLQQIIKAQRDMGFYTIKHTDGNIMPIVDQMVQCNPHALHSIDPQAGVSLSEVKRLYGDKVALCGNVNCGLLQTGTDEEVAADVRRSLREGMADGFGYIFCTSNCVYTGLPLKRYEMMNEIWRNEGFFENK